MKILVLLKQVPDTMDVKLSGDFTLQREAVAQVTNPADESALELGLTLRDALGGSVTVMTMGLPRAEGMLREAISRGAEEAALLTDPRFAGADTLATARTLRAAQEVLGPFDLILCGRRAADGETGQVGPMMAALMNIPCVANATKVHWEKDAFIVQQLTEGGLLQWEVPPPALVTLCEWSHPLRLPSLAGLRGAAKAVVRRFTAADLGLDPQECGLKGSPTRVIRVSVRPAGIRSCQKLTLQELLEKGVLP